MIMLTHYYPQVSLLKVLTMIHTTGSDKGTDKTLRYVDILSPLYLYQDVKCWQVYEKALPPDDTSFFAFQ